jgi:DNA-binding transcriptional ArsR family regulator
MPVEDYTSPISDPQFVIALEPAQNAFNSLTMMSKKKKRSAFSGWLQETWDSMTSEEQNNHMVVMSGLHYVVSPKRSYSSFNTYITDLAASDPVTLRDEMLDMYARIDPESEICTLAEETPDYDKASVLSSFEAYMEFLCEHFDVNYIDIEIERQAYSYAIDPPAMQAFIISHLRHMWERYMAPEWERVNPMLKDAVRAFQQINFQGMSNMEAAQLVIDQEPDPCLQAALEKAERVVFIPSAHIGPHVGRFTFNDGTLGIIFNARLPKGVVIDAPDLSRNELLVRLIALADDNRLRILKHVADNGEQRSQDIMRALNLSQSAASRHLKQLSATGFLCERRCEGAKCYRLNSERLDETLDATRTFLLGEEALTYSFSQNRGKIFA